MPDVENSGRHGQIALGGPLRLSRRPSEVCLEKAEVSVTGGEPMKDNTKRWKEMLRRRTAAAGRWLRALLALLDDLMAVSLGGFFAGQGLVAERSRRDER